MIRLYSYWRSSAAYRVRIGLNLKGLEYELHTVNMVREGGEHRLPAYRQLNPQGKIPTLEDGELRLTQSLAILEYLEERYPQVPLLPAQPAPRAVARQLALLIACDIHPLNNLGVLQYLSGELDVAEDARSAWYRHWILEGFRALETLIEGRGAGGPYCLGAEPCLADICLVPQVYNARRFQVPLDAFPRIRAIEAACLELPAFRNAAPDNQPDAV